MNRLTIASHWGLGEAWLIGYWLIYGYKSHEKFPRKQHEKIEKMR